MGNSPSTPTTKTLKSNEKPFLGFDEYNLPILSEQKIPVKEEKPRKEKKEKYMEQIEKIKDDYIQIKNDCPPCPKYNFEGSYEESQIRKQLKIALKARIDQLLQINNNDRSKAIKELIFKLIESKDKSPIDDITFEFLIEEKFILNVIDQKMIKIINEKGTPGQIKALSSKLDKNLKSQLKTLEPPKQEILLLEPPKTVSPKDMQVDSEEPLQNKNTVMIPQQGTLESKTVNEMKYLKYKEKYLKLKYN
jgi:hypothetical protein